MEPNHSPTPQELEASVRERYARGAVAREPALCCPIDYDPRFLAAIPKDVLDRDYGCGDPSRWVREGDTVLDLGSGGGKIAFIAAQIAGPNGRVIGVDFNPDMLALARRAAPEVAARIGHGNVEFRRGRIQDLALDLDRLDAWLEKNPVNSVEDLSALEAENERLRREQPLVADDSVDLVVSNCVLNLVHESYKPKLVREIFRVLKRGGRIAISDIVSDEPVPADLKNDPALWSGCVSGAFHEAELLAELEAAGFHGISIAHWQAEPFRVVRGIEFRSVTVTARKGKSGPCVEGLEAILYRGPWKQVLDDDGHVLRRGERVAVCEKTFRILSSEPYASEVIAIPPHAAARPSEPLGFDCSRTAARHPRETKGIGYDTTTSATTTNAADAGLAPSANAANNACCGPEGCS